MPLDTGLLLALVESTLDTDENLTRDRRDRLDAVALLLASRPRLALAWGQVLTEHTAPPVEAAREPIGVHVHPFTAAGPHRILCLARAADDTVCGHREDAPVHRDEVLTNKQRDLLEDLLQTGPRIGVSTSLVDLRFAEYISAGYVITPRGRAWLEAHPREGGERE